MEGGARHIGKFNGATSRFVLDQISSFKIAERLFSPFRLRHMTP